jgi:hypothetical protein
MQSFINYECCGATYVFDGPSMEVSVICFQCRFCGCVNALESRKMGSGPVSIRDRLKIAASAFEQCLKKRKTEEDYEEGEVFTMGFW